MSLNLIAKATTTIKAPSSKVWEAITTPDMVKKYFFGSEPVSEWKPGSAIEFEGTWEGKPYKDKGVILQMLPGKLFQHTYYSPLSGMEDAPENYANVSYELNEEDGETLVTVRQENIQDERVKEHSEELWTTVLQQMKELVEKNSN